MDMLSVISVLCFVIVAFYVGYKIGYKARKK